MAFVTLVTGSNATAAIVNLETLGSTTTIDGVIIRTGDQAGGEGVAKTFVQLFDDRDHAVEGYNTSGSPKPFNVGNADPHNFDLQMFQVPTLVVGGIYYFEFFIDLNEENPSSDSGRVALTDLRFYTSPTGSSTTETLSLLGDLRWSMPSDTDLLLHTFTSGGGLADYQVLVPVSLFFTGDPATSVLPTDFLYLYSAFGGDLPGFTGEETSDGFDGWATRQGTQELPPESPAIPEPATLTLLGLAGLGLLRRRGA